nr:glycosyltransferase [Lachnospiraceae bacterium]
LKIVNLNLGVKKGIIAKTFTVFKRASALKKVKRKIRPKIAYSFGSSANIVNCLSKVRKVRTWVGLRSYMDMFDPSRISYFARKADLIVCCSKVIEDEIRTEYRCKKAVTLYNPYDADKMMEDAEEKASLPWDDKFAVEYGAYYPIFNLICMGREDDVKGYWHAIKAFSLVREEIFGARLIFIGDGDFGKYQKLAEDLKISEYVYFAGLQKNPYKLLKKGSVCLLTSENEGFPNCLVEGMLLGNAAVAVDCVSGPKEILEDGKYGILLPDFTHGVNLDPKDITAEDRAFAEAIIALLKDPEKLKKYRELAATRARDFSHEKYIERFMSFANGK